MPGDKLITVDHPSNQKRGGICIHHKDFFPIRVNNISCLKECLNFNLSVYGKQCNITLICRSPSQSSEEFGTFLSNLELLLDYIANRNPFVSIIIGDFNARSNNWCSSNKTTYEGKKLDFLTSQCGFKQVISDPTHILESSSSCIDLIFTSQPNAVMNSGVLSSLHPNCHHQIIHAKFNLKIFYPPPYERVVWHYQDANNDRIQRSISHFNWERAFSNKCVNNETALNIMTNFISNETKIFNDRKPPWINNKVKTMIQEKNKIYQLYLKNKSNMSATKLERLQNLIYKTLDSCKSKYYEIMSKKLCSKAITPKYYWSLLKTKLNEKKIPFIPPIFHDNKFVTDFSKKADLFNSFFAKQYSIIENNSVLPSSINRITDKYLGNIELKEDDIKRIICKLDLNKAHGHDMISICMLKMSGDAIIEPLFKIFKICLKCGIFPDDWKKGNIVPIFKKGDKQNIKNYRAVSLLPICSKIFERVIYNNMLNGVVLSGQFSSWIKVNAGVPQ